MGKSNKKGAANSKGGKPSSSEQAQATKNCTCDHPYQCSCGNRPPRPSKGHKWDPSTQQWGGKGHKQKGASGQTGVIGQATTTTSVGQTYLAQWQQLPSTILKEYCQKQKRPLPKFKALDVQKDYKCRCIVPDPKRDSNKDLFFVPAQPVGNAEQAQEEAALLALLYLTPSLPHERKLPEPYKTTWLTALEATKNKSKTNVNEYSNVNVNDNNATARTHTSSSSTSASSYTNKAVANTNLAMASKHVSNAERQKQQQEKQHQVNARIRRHEAIRMANRNHPVFLSAKLRQQIQKLLRGESNTIADDDNDNDDENDDEEEQDPTLRQFNSDLQQYIEERLHQEGFTKRQARKATTQVLSSPNITAKTATEQDWDHSYEQALQWLCVHLPEEQLPEGFDPRGSTLEVMAPKMSESTAAKISVNKPSVETSSMSPEIDKIAKIWGIDLPDAQWLNEKTNAELKCDTAELFWNRTLELAGVQRNFTCNDPKSLDASSLADELEALEAMFPEGMSEREENGFLTLEIPLDERGWHLVITFDRQQYPQTIPNITCQHHNAASWKRPGISVAWHVKMAEFLAGSESLSLLEVYGQAQALMASLEDMEPIKLRESGLSDGPINDGRPAATAAALKSISTATPSHKAPSANKFAPSTKQKPRIWHAQRVRGAFWSTPPSQTPPAVAHPEIRPSLQKQRSDLPAGKARQEFLSRMAGSSRVVLVTGDTGCGKTTQIPQFILEEAPDSSKIVVAQPRRLAATGVAARVAEERGESQPGLESVGYVVRGDSALGAKTRLLFCTFGILLRQLQCDGALGCITHIVIDEVHERNLDGDVLMALLKQSLDVYPQLQIVLMSATLDADRFANYWGAGTPRMHIPGRTFPVQDFFLEDVLQLTGYNPPKKKKRFYHHGNGNSYQSRQRKSSPWDDSELSDGDGDGDNEAVQETGQAPVKESREEPQISLDRSEVPLEERMKRVDPSHLDYDLLAQLVRSLLQTNSTGDDGSILIFLSGAPEINRAVGVMEKVLRDFQVLLLPLHGGLQPKEQNKVFRPPSAGTKVVLSTNVAETSVTIPDCTVVIDCCREKQSSYHPVNRMPLLTEVFASKASMKQRRGRAGRVREGKCYKLIPRAAHDRLHDHTEPEIARCALDQTLLSLFFLGVETGDGKFLQSLLDSPRQESVRASIESLKLMGAVDQIQLSEVNLTPLGAQIARIPAPPLIGKMLIMGSILGCRGSGLAMAAGISAGRSPFLRVDMPRGAGSNDNPQQQKDRAMLEARAKLRERCGNSDHALLAAAFLNWNDLPSGGGERKKYCEKLGLSFPGMRDILQLVNQYDSALAAAGYSNSSESNRNATSWRVLRACAVSSMAPGQLVRVHRPATKYADTVEGARELDGLAKEMKFFIRVEDEDGKVKEERVFIHPSSALFTTGNYSCPWLVYNSMVKTSKPFLRDATECSAYPLLLFGGKLEVQARNGVLVVDDWVQLSANARVGSLMQGLRNRIDELLLSKIQNPSLDISKSPEMQLVVRLILSDGMQ